MLECLTLWLCARVSLPDRRGLFLDLPPACPNYQRGEDRANLNPERKKRMTAHIASHARPPPLCGKSQTLLARAIIELPRSCLVASIRPRRVVLATPSLSGRAMVEDGVCVSLALRRSLLGRSETNGESVYPHGVLAADRRNCGGLFIRPGVYDRPASVRRPVGDHNAGLLRRPSQSVPELTCDL